jgi:hypothetical protein
MSPFFTEKNNTILCLVLCIVPVHVHISDIGSNLQGLEHIGLSWRYTGQCEWILECWECYKPTRLTAKKKNITASKTVTNSSQTASSSRTTSTSNSKSSTRSNSSTSHQINKNTDLKFRTKACYKYKDLVGSSSKR